MECKLVRGKIPVVLMDCCRGGGTFTSKKDLMQIDLKALLSLMSTKKLGHMKKLCLAGQP